MPASRLIHPTSAVDPSLLTGDLTTVELIGDPVVAVTLGSRVALPTSTYLYNPATHLWIPQVGAADGTVLEFNSGRIANFLSSLLTCCDLSGEELRRIQALIAQLIAEDELAIGVHDEPAPAEVKQEGLAAYTDPSTLPAAVSADGDSVRAAGSLLGEQYSYLSRNIAGEDDAVGAPYGRMISERRLSVGGRVTNVTPGLGGQLIPAGTGVLGNVTFYNIDPAVGVTVILYDNTAAAGTVLDEFFVAPGTTESHDLDVYYAIGVYASFSAGAAVAYCFGTGRARQG